jgi:hypothetical protein
MRQSLTEAFSLVMCDVLYDVISFQENGDNQPFISSSINEAGSSEADSMSSEADSMANEADSSEADSSEEDSSEDELEEGDISEAGPNFREDSVIFPTLETIIQEYQSMEEPNSHSNLGQWLMNQPLYDLDHPNIPIYDDQSNTPEYID